MSNEIGFKPKARLVLQLGDQLIRSESIAMLELIKNSYDACASLVKVEMSNLESPQVGEITIEDDGHGMDYQIIKDVWLHPGTNFKKAQIDDDKFTNPCDRLPLGEKGIGRFGAHKLGEEIELISKTKNGKKEAVLKIDWRDFNNNDFLSDIPIDLTERTPKHFVNGATGTKIIIRGLRTTWTRGSVRDLHRAITSLNSPFKSLSSFRVSFKIDKPEWLTGLLKFKDVKDYSLFSADATITGNEISSLEYKFTPWPKMKGLKERQHVEREIPMVRRAFDEAQKKKILKDIDISKYNIGTIKIKLLIFDFENMLLALAGIEDKKGLKDYLKLNGGLRVYRNDVRVYDYGEPGNDWLNLDLDRVNFPTARISNNIVIGSIQIDRKSSKDLIEKTNREGFIQNDAYWEFHNAIRFTIGRIITQRNIDKDKLRSHYGKSTRVPIGDNLDILKEKIQSNLSDNTARKEILGIISDIQDDYKTITEVYIRSASAGLSLSIVIHEIEKIIQELLYVVEESGKKGEGSERIRNLTWHLGRLIDGYSGLIRRKSKKESLLTQIVENSLWNIEFRLTAHKIEVVKAFEKKKDFIKKVRCSDSLIIGTIVNIIDNSIWWLSYGKVQQKKIFLDVTDEYEGHVTILIADNGPGFTLPTEEVIKPFISNKDGGIGIGLHLAHEIMNSHGGELLFPAPNDFTLPKEFRSGAIVALAFKESKKE